MNIASKITIGQQNVGKSIIPKNALQSNLDDYDIVLCIQEPNIHDGKVGGISQNVVTFHSKTRYRSVVAVVNKSISVMDVLTASNIDAVSIGIVPDIKIVVVSIYLLAIH